MTAPAFLTHHAASIRDAKPIKSQRKGMLDSGKKTDEIVKNEVFHLLNLYVKMWHRVRGESGLSCTVSKRLMSEAVRFHGHLGAFLVLSLKAGLFANEVLGKDSFKTRAIVETEPAPPCSCVVDGLQIVTGCTMGKRNIELKRGASFSVTFLKGDHRLRLSLKKDILESLRKISSENESEQAALALSDKSIQELFDIERRSLI